MEWAVVADEAQTDEREGMMGLIEMIELAGTMDSVSTMTTTWFHQTLGLTPLSLHHSHFCRLRVLVWGRLWARVPYGSALGTVDGSGIPNPLSPSVDPRGEVPEATSVLLSTAASNGVSGEGVERL